MTTLDQNENPWIEPAPPAANSGFKVGWVGLGDQGSPMARAIADAGFELNVWVRRASSLAALDGLPYVRHDTLAGLGATSDIVGLCLREDSDIEEVLTTGGLLESLAPGTVLINHATGCQGTPTAWPNAQLPPGYLSLTLRSAADGPAPKRVG